MRLDVPPHYQRFSRSLALLFICLLHVSAIVDSTPSMDWEGRSWLSKNKDKPDVIVTPSGLQYRVLKAGPADSPRVTNTSECICLYRTLLTDGTEIDSTYREHPQPSLPVLFKLDHVSSGWKETLQLMRQGDTWEIAVPADLGHDGEPRVKAASLPHGSNTILLYKVELLQVREPGQGHTPAISWKLLSRVLFMFLPVLLVPLCCWGAKLIKGSHLKPEDVSDPTNPRVFFEVSIDGKASGRIEMELFSKLCPKTSENFRCLCTGEKGEGASGKRLHFKGTTFHTIVKEFKCQGGDILGTRKGGESIYGGKFEDEWQNGVIFHSRAMLLSMANTGPDSNGSSFSIMFGPGPQLDRRCIVFGQVIFGQDVVKSIEAVGRPRKFGGLPPKSVVTIEDCGEAKSKVA